MTPWQQILYEENRQHLFSIALAICGCASLAEDAVHDAFVRLAKAKKPAENVRAYVFTAVRNSAIDHCRSRARDKSRLVSLFETPEAMFAAEGLSAANAVAASQLTSLLDSLPSEVKEILVLKVFANLTFREIGSIVGRPHKTVATQYRRALITVRRQYESQLDSEKVVE